MGATDSEINYPAPNSPVSRPMQSTEIIETIEANPGFFCHAWSADQRRTSNLRNPGIAAKVSRCVVMGGNPCCEGNVTPAAEYNIWVDPEAASIVMRSGLPVELIGWQLCRGQAVLSSEDIDHILAFRTKLADFAIECNSHARKASKIQTGEDGICLPDPVAMCVALDPSIGTTWGDHYVEVETASELTRGMTVVDRLNVADDDRNRGVWQPAIDSGHKAKVCWEIDNARWKNALYSALR